MLSNCRVIACISPSVLLLGVFLAACLLIVYSVEIQAQEQGSTPQDTAATVTVYKKWIGTAVEADVRISLDCESGDYSGYRFINEGTPSGWEIRNIDPEGILCNVSEAVRENFRPDIVDCQGLYLLPGTHEECTLVNTQIVKHIEMLNRYGKIVMIVLFLAVGLLTMKRLS